MVRRRAPIRRLPLLLAVLAGCSGAHRDVDVGTRPSDSGAPSSVGTPSDAGGSSDVRAAACSVSPAEFDGTWTVGTSGNTTYHRFDHPSPRGLVVALHGTNGSSESVARKKREWQGFHAAARARGYSLLVPESEQRDKPRRWDNAPTADNVDLRRIATLVDDAITTGRLPARSPVYFIGMSQGAGVAPIYGQLLASRGYPVRAVASYCGGASGVYARSEYTLPTTFAAMAADDVIPDGASAVASNVAALAARGIPSSSYVKPVEVLCPERFTRMPSVDGAASRAIFDGLVAGGVVDATGNVLKHGSDLEGAAPPGLPSAYAALADEVDEQLQVVAAGHAFFGDRDQETLAFFGAYP